MAFLQPRPSHWFFPISSLYMDVQDASAMPPEQTYTVECVRWSIRDRCERLFRLTYRRVWLPERSIWANYLIWAEEVS